MESHELGVASKKRSQRLHKAALCTRTRIRARAKAAGC